MRTLRNLSRQQRVEAVWSGAIIVVLRDAAGRLYDVTGWDETAPGVVTIGIAPADDREASCRGI